MRAAPIALVTGLLPLICVHITYLIAASYGHVDWCIPYWDSCTSISATGRQLPEKLLFKLMMLPAGMLAILFWWLANQWLRQVGAMRVRAMLACGGLGGLFLMLYVVALGEGRDYQVIRRIGIILFFSLTFVAQLCFLAACYRARARLAIATWRVIRLQIGMAIVLLAIGITTLLLDLWYAGYDNIEDAFEWVMMLFIAAQFLSHYPLWKRTVLQIGVSSAQDSAGSRKRSASPE